MNIEPFLNASPAIQIHMTAAIAALVLGAFVLWRRKGGAAHKRNGRIWVGLMMVTALSGFFIHEIRMWGNYSPIHIISFLVPISLAYGIREARSGRIAAHQTTMKSAYAGGMIIAGGFTFLPGRLSHEIFLGSDGGDLVPAYGWVLPFIGAAIVFAYFALRNNNRNTTN